MLLPKIKILDKQTANKIAAGEVVERPYSVVKELVENALDAGASRVNVDIKDGGITSVSVSDNGCGIGPQDATRAFLRHATSKINCVEDLFRISTLGFRGEALASIAAVSVVTMVTRTHDCDVGIQIVVEGGNIIANEPAGCQPGTSILVEDLFYNTPARKKHLKTAPAETAQISDLLTRLAFSRPDVKFKLTSQNRVLLETPGNGKLLDTFAAVNGVRTARKMLPITGQANGLYITGYISNPELNRASRTQQTILVNGRYVKSKLISNALQQGYHTLLSSSRHPLAVLALEIEPTLVDVNVHPAKMEVRISREKQLYRLIVSCVQKALRTLLVIPELEQRTPVKEQPKDNLEQILETEQPTHTQLKMDITSRAPGDKVEPVTLTQNQTTTNLRDTLAQPEPKIGILREVNINYETGQEFPALLPVGQLLPTYILAQGPAGLYIIDQHAAHERVLYEYYNQQQQKEHDSQLLLVPVVLELNHREAQLLIEQIITFRQLGFIIEHFGGNNYLLRGMPHGFPPGEEAHFFFDVLDTSTDQFHEKLVASLACRGAIKSGQKLSIKEMQTLIEQMSKLENPYSCPHGRPTIIHVSFDELAKRFKR